MAGSDDDRRRHPRLHLDGRTGGRATVFADFKVVALSEDGACLEMATPLAVDSQCDITLNLAHVTVDLRGRVVHVEQPPALAGAYHVGISFVRVEALDRALLESFLDRERQRAGA
ncbi:MAG TPA: PilZ domain-containing protein [Vicinamibacteria bacterium]|nr:PilZ domain-containing protein [Vicinamibacteria bacterium]